MDTRPEQQGKWQPGGLNWPEIRPIYPCPDTPQYTQQLPRPNPGIELPSEPIECEGWVLVNLQHYIDAQFATFAEKRLVGVGPEQWYFGRTDGWVLYFWNTDDTGELGRRPVGFFDLRVIVHTGVLGAGGLFKVDAGLNGGELSFKVKSRHEAEMWASAMRQALVAKVHMDRIHKEEGLERAQLARSTFHASPPKGGTEMMSFQEPTRQVYYVNPQRVKALRKIWESCVSGADRGPNVDTYIELFDMYNADMNDDLDLNEMEVMVRDLAVVREQELERVLAVSRARMLDSRRLKLDGAAALSRWQREIGAPGKRLQQMYDCYLQAGGAESRAILLRSEMDTSRDGRVTPSEFLQNAPIFLMPPAELLLEAQFYKQCEQAMRADRHQEDEEDGGCLQM
mmetsp:Transcript_123086/g.245028  ORF Transcript_123086/g.245028 Transcript_123086/m.245028 type:complete len:397 (-) Transcript_123086:144-1334(-)